jgi:hypothetical protein
VLFAPAYILNLGAQESVSQRVLALNLNPGLLWDASNIDSYPGTGATIFDVSGNGRDGTKKHSSGAPDLSFLGTAGNGTSSERFTFTSSGTLHAAYFETDVSDGFLQNFPNSGSVSVFGWCKVSGANSQLNYSHLKYGTGLPTSLNGYYEFSTGVQYHSWQVGTDKGTSGPAGSMVLALANHGADGQVSSVKQENGDDQVPDDGSWAFVGFAANGSSHSITFNINGVSDTHTYDYWVGSSNFESDTFRCGKALNSGGTLQFHSFGAWHSNIGSAGLNSIFDATRAVFGI